jgi:hypothetical protein
MVGPFFVQRVLSTVVVANRVLRSAIGPSQMPPLGAIILSHE